MAQSARRTRRDAPKTSLKDIIKAGPTSSLEALAFAAIGLGFGLGLGLSAGAREWSREALGYGWIPVAIWISAALATLRYNRHSVKAHWRWWVAAAALTAVCIGILSQIHAENGTLAETGLSGRWGQTIGGSPLILAVAKLAVVAIVVPLLLFPNAVGAVYLRGLRYLGMGMQFAPVYAYMGLSRTYYFLNQRLRTVRNPLLRESSLNNAKSTIGRHLPEKLRTRFGDDKDDRSGGLHGIEGGESPQGEEHEGQPPSLWADTAPGSLPEWHISQQANPRQASKTVSSAAGGKGLKWVVPSMDILAPAEPRTTADEPLQQMARHVERTLADHGVNVEVKDIKAGPRIVRFGLVPGWVTKRGDSLKGASKGNSSGEDEPAQGERSRVKVQSILMREKDLALALQTPYLRIEAPVPGEALVGLEVPTPSPTKVHLRSVMEASSFGLLAAKGGLPIALGQDTSGAPVVMDLASMPHMLIAGATGSGKSVCINSVVASLLLTKPPDQLRFLMVDPKRVELTPFNGIPHLIMPVIVETDQVNAALRGLMREMLRRYKKMEDLGARNIASYNNKADECLPFLVLVVDELADLMIAGGFEVEQNLVRLAQLGRATGIHLVLATQRPSVNVVTGLLKANVPTRAAFAVASQVDSRVILDSIGAEKLLGKGDMLLLHNDSPKPRRVQGTLVYDEEIEQIVDHWIDHKGPPLPEIPMGDISGDDEDEVDEGMMDQARDLALRHPHLSPSFLERRLKVGGWKAAQIVEILEEEGLIVNR
jgi:DNA segregation ATPase FtsK/SpoIIIE-like protein